MTEASHQMSSNPLPSNGSCKPSSVGVGTGVLISVVDEKGNILPPGQHGEVSVSGPNVTLGYANNPNANASTFFMSSDPKNKNVQTRWLRTGDQGYLDEQGYLFLTGRIKELIIRGGEKISPLEVDAALLAHPQVLEAVSFSVPDSIYGEEVHAAIIPKQQINSKEEEENLRKEILQVCAEKLLPFKRPKQLYISTDLPRTPTGKIQRRIVSAHFVSLSKQNLTSKL